MSGRPNVWGSKCPGDCLYKGFYMEEETPLIMLLTTLYMKWKYIKTTNMGDFIFF